MAVTLNQYEPVKVERFDIVGYKGSGEFVILSAAKFSDRKLPSAHGSFIERLPVFIPAIVTNNQEINFNGETANLHDIGGVWYYKLREAGSMPELLASNVFFEIGKAL